MIVIARKINSGEGVAAPSGWTTCEVIFPELRESEDERIRKAIGYAIGQSTHSDGTLINGVSSEEALAWLEKQYADPIKEYWRGYNEGKQNVLDKYSELEKQGEQKPTEVRTTGYWNVQDVEIPFGAKDSELIAESYYIPKGFHAEIDGDKVIIKKGEKPTAWSEEDSPYYDDICEILINFLHSETADVNKGAIQKDLDWLKSLKPQSHWKPSEEQMKILNKVIFCTYNANNIEDRKHIESLYNDLKKLI